MQLPKVHFTKSYLLNPTNPITVNLIGAGGTGSNVLTALARIHESLLALGHIGLAVQVFDDDTVSPANRGRQLFSTSEIGLNKGVALINRINRFFGTAWKAIPGRFDETMINDKSMEKCSANITVSCVDTVKARTDIAKFLIKAEEQIDYIVREPFYWLDFGNKLNTGQAVLATVGTIEQPSSSKYEGMGNLPFVTEEYGYLLENASDNDQPSCSVADALGKQDLFINPALAQMGTALLWRMFREGMLKHRGLFLNLENFRTQPIPIL